jgi:hypothetical protein
MIDDTSLYRSLHIHTTIILSIHSFSSSTVPTAVRRHREWEAFTAYGSCQLPCLVNVFENELTSKINFIVMAELSRVLGYIHFSTAIPGFLRERDILCRTIDTISSLSPNWRVKLLNMLLFLRCFGRKVGPYGNGEE